jgi:hypothetical protein
MQEEGRASLRLGRESKEDNSDKHVPIKSLKSRTGARSPQ